MSYTPKARLGAFTKRITIQTPTETVDTNGQPVVTWADWLVNEPCHFNPTGGGESTRGRQVEENTRAIFTVNYRDGYTSNMQIIYGGESYGITYVKPVEGGRRFIELVVKS